MALPESGPISLTDIQIEFAIQSVVVQYQVVAGGGGGGGTYFNGQIVVSGGGGGSGGVRTGSINVTSGQTLTITVGGGGGGSGYNSQALGGTGGSSSIGATVATGGAGGQSYIFGGDSSPPGGAGGSPNGGTGGDGAFPSDVGGAGGTNGTGYGTGGQGGVGFTAAGNPGGSGIVVIQYNSSYGVLFTGGSINVNGTTYTHTFLSSGILSPIVPWPIPGPSSSIVLSDYYKGGAYVLNTDYAPNVPRSGPISLSDFYGARRTFVTTETFTTQGDNLFIVPTTIVGNLFVTMTGGGGGGGGPDSYPGRAGYPGLVVTNSQIPVAAGDIVNAFVATGGGPGGSGGGGGGGGGKIICTKLYELGLMSKDIYEADQAFGAQLLESRPDIYNGYRAWAEIVVDWMSGQGPIMMPWMSQEEFASAAKSWSVSWAQDIATPWAEHMAYKMGKLQKDNLTGRMITVAGIPICKAVGVWQRIFGPSKRPAGFVKGAMLVPVFVMFKVVAELGKLIEGKKS